MCTLCYNVDHNSPLPQTTWCVPYAKNIDHNSPLPQTTWCVPYATMLIIIPLCHKQHDVSPMPKMLVIITICHKRHDVCPMPKILIINTLCQKQHDVYPMPKILRRECIIFFQVLLIFFLIIWLELSLFDLWLFRSFYLRRSSTENLVESDFLIRILFQVYFDFA
jgi:hypothetical protein